MRLCTALTKDKGNYYSHAKFLSMCNCGGFIDNDGFGHPVRQIPGEDCLDVNEDVIVKPSDFHTVSREDTIGVLWFNN